MEPKRVVLLCACSFLGSLTVLAPVALLADLTAALDSPETVLAQLFSGTLILSAIAGLAIGPLAGRFGPKPLLAVGAVAAALALAIVAMSHSLGLLFLSCLPGGVADAALLGLPLIVAAANRGETHRAAIGWVLASTAAAPVLGVPLLVVMRDLVSWRAAFFAASGLALVIALCVARLFPGARESLTWPRVGPVQLYRLSLQHRSLRRLYLAAILGFLVWNAQLAYLGVFLKDHLDLSSRWIAIGYPVSGAAYFVGGLVGGRARIISPRVMAVVGTAALGLACTASFTAFETPGLVIGFFAVAALAAAIGTVALTVLVGSSDPSMGVAGVAITGVIATLGAAVGGGVGGLILSLGGYRALGIGLGITGIIAALIVLPSVDVAEDRAKFEPGT